MSSLNFITCSTNSTLASLSNNSDGHTNSQQPITASGSSSSLTGATEKRESTPGPSNQSNVSSSSLIDKTIKNSTAVTNSISTRYIE